MFNESFKQLYSLEIKKVLSATVLWSRFQWPQLFSPLNTVSGFFFTHSCNLPTICMICRQFRLKYLLNFMIIVHSFFLVYVPFISWSSDIWSFCFCFLFLLVWGFFKGLFLLLVLQMIQMYISFHINANVKIICFKNIHQHAQTHALTFNYLYLII